jgi:hypothetical protein
MSELDRMIEATLNEEDRAFFARLEREPGFFGQLIGLLAGPVGWINLVMLIALIAFFFGGVWCAWEFLQTSDVITALRWGLSSATLLIVAAILKIGTLWPSFQTNRMLREIKRLELQIARSNKA